MAQPTGIKLNKVLKVTQIVEVDTHNGECITSCFPTNKEITDFYANRYNLPVVVKRILMFLRSVPPEYAWTDVATR